MLWSGHMKCITEFGKLGICHGNRTHNHDGLLITPKASYDIQELFIFLNFEIIWKLKVWGILYGFLFPVTSKRTRKENLCLWEYCSGYRLQSPHRPMILHRRRKALHFILTTMKEDKYCFFHPHTRLGNAIFLLPKNRIVRWCHNITAPNLETTSNFN